MADELVPGDQPSYQLCKTIYTLHPLGAKIAESPVAMAMSQPRTIAIPKGPEDRLREQFQLQWEKDCCDKHIFNAKRLSRVYGISTLALMSKGTPPDRPIDYKALPKAEIGFNVLDPLNTSGSLVLDQNPNSLYFQRPQRVSVSGQAYHPSRVVVVMNEDPLYIDYTQSAFGFVGRSSYQRALFPLKTYIQSMITDDLVVVKVGVLVAMMQAAGSIVDQVMATITGSKRALLKEAATGAVLSIGKDDKIESLNMENVDKAHDAARRHLLENIAAGVPMPAKLLLQESFAEGFGEGTEDSKYIAGYIDEVRKQMAPMYTFMDEITKARAWNPDFYKIIQDEFPEYEGVPYTRAFYDWSNSFQASWPSLLREPESELIKVDDVKLKALIAAVEILLPAMDPENKVRLIEWLADNFNMLKRLFPEPLELDYEALESYEPPQQLEEPGQPKPFAAQDSEPAFSPRALRAIERSDVAVKAMVESVLARKPAKRERRSVQ